MKSSYRKKETNRIFHYVVLLSMPIFLCLMLSSCKKADLRASGFPEPLAESQVMELTIKSDHMGREMPYLIYLPKGYGAGKEYPVWYGLNGYSSDESFWIDNGIADTADVLIEQSAIDPIIMVFPYVMDASFKEISADFEEDGDFDERKIDQYLSQELVPYIDAHYYTIKEAEGRYIGGFSMGGMIALRVAFHHTDLFSKVGGYSAGVIYSDYSNKQLEEWLYPNDNFDDINDISDFDKEKGFDKLQVYLDAGNENDPFSVGLQSLNDALQKRGIKSDFQLLDGGHNLQPDNLEDYLKFYAD